MEVGGGHGRKRICPERGGFARVAQGQLEITQLDIPSVVRRNMPRRIAARPLAKIGTVQ